MMRTLLILAAIIGFSASAFAQTAAPKVGGKPLKQVKPPAPMGCKLVGTVKGTKRLSRDIQTCSKAASDPLATRKRFMAINIRSSPTLDGAMDT